MRLSLRATNITAPFRNALADPHVEVELFAELWKVLSWNQKTERGPRRGTMNQREYRDG